MTRNIPAVSVEYYDTKAWIRNTATIINKLIGEANNQTPVGVMQPYPGTIAPEGWLLCNGQTVSRVEFADLFSLIGVTYGAGDGSTTFALPDTRDRLLIGAGTLVSLGATAGANELTILKDNLPDYALPVTDAGHTHTFTADAHNHTITDSGHNHAITDSGHAHTITDPGHVHGGAVTAAAGTEYSNASGNDGVTGDTSSATTGITIDSGTTGVSVDSNTTGVTVDNETVTGSNATSTTGVGVSLNGGGQAINILNPSLGVTWIIKT